MLADCDGYGYHYKCKCYGRYPAKTYDDAHNYCQGKGEKLAEPMTLDENEGIKSFITGGRVWIGIKKHASANM